MVCLREIQEHPEVVAAVGEYQQGQQGSQVHQEAVEEEGELLLLLERRSLVLRRHRSWVQWKQSRP